LAKLPELRIEDQNAEFGRAWLDDLRVDLLFTKSKLFEAVRKKHTTSRQFVERELPCATVSGLMLTKLYALPSLYRQGQFSKVSIYEHDVAELIYKFRPDLAPVFDELSKHVLPSDLDEIRRIVAEIEDRIARQSQRFGPAE
jgi:hypothetical protein